MLHFIFLKSEVVMGKLGHSDVKWAHVKTSNVDLYIFEKKHFVCQSLKYQRLIPSELGTYELIAQPGYPIWTH